MDDIRPFLEKILTIIEYEDKNKFIDGFLKICLQKSLADYINLLPEERRKEMLPILEETDVNRLNEQLAPYITTEEFQKLFQEHMKKLLEEYLETIRPTLSHEQEAEINAFFLSLTSTSQQVPSQSI